MTPAEQKAELLVSKYCHISRGDDTISPKQSAKQCALIAVELLIEHLPSSDGNPPNLPMYERNKEYWILVKTAIEQMP